MGKFVQLNIYLGAFRTGGQHLFAMARANEAMLNDQGIFLVQRDDFNAAFSDATKSAEHGIDRAQIQDKLLSTLAQGRDAKTLLYFDPLLSGNITRPVGAGLIFPRIKNFARSLASVIDHDKINLAMSVREPSAFLASCYGQALINAHVVPFEDYVSDVKLDVIRWSNCLERLTTPFFDETTQTYGVKPIIWRIEDYPYIWRQALGAITGVENPQDLVGTSTPNNAGLSLYGSHLMYKYLQKHAPKARGDFKKVREAFLEKYPNDASKPDDPFWNADQIKEMQYAYDDDWYFIERMENVQALRRQIVT
ncbi:hypothetical protein [Paramylibacter ulvae]|uniref:hypothetical protein n=1 Tax=Paramylibacter ulvae TaxID=1651968 RepID=UPI001E29FDC8|nr:hypothetical protein [Amylibacter ulvae]